MANKLPKGKKVDWDEVKQAAKNIRNEKNNLQETIEGICKTHFPIGKVTASNEELDEPLTRIVNHEANKAIAEATEAILQAVRDVVPEAQKDYNGKELSTDFDNYEAGYNQCRLDILKELGGGNE